MPVYPCGLSSDLDDQLARLVVDERARVVDPSRRVGGPSDPWFGSVRDKRDAAGPDVFEADHDFRFSAGRVVGNFMGDQTLLEAFEVEILAVAQELLAVLFRSDLYWIPAQKMEELCKDFC